MPSPAPDELTQARMETAHRHAADRIGINCDGPPAWGWGGRTIGRRGGPHWLRLLSCPADMARGKLWTGTQDAETAFPASVPRPRLIDVYEWQGDSTAYRAELTTYVDQPVISTSPDISHTPVLPPAWWSRLRAALYTVAKAPTERQAVRAQWISRGFPAYLGIPAPPAVEWVTSHADLHWANITAGPLTVLDWEAWGLAPAGYDAGHLHAYSLRIPLLAARVRAEFAATLNTPAGQTGELTALAQLLQVASRGGHPELHTAWRARAEELTGTPPPRW
ncbi:phosphotransferase [Streptomyces sp. NPDC051162]|uniref:phosphotransferase n=1 Tax=Streptomyces sp. NPDC051162 TaxID=3154747 RepID=UPI00341B7552